MSNIALIRAEKATHINSFLVGRLLPFREKRNVGPFVFIDHMGPVEMEENENLDIAPHPHIGLSTLTYLIEGTITHRDSLGTLVDIKPGAVNWMTAGKGITHSERTPEHLRGKQKKLHGLQIWVAMPKDLENSTPSFSHIAANEIPSWKDNGATFKLIAGEALGKKSVVPVLSKLYFIEVKSAEKEITLNIGKQLYGESALYILEGNIEIESVKFTPKQLVIAKDTQLCEFKMAANSIVYIFGGEVFPEERFIDWNFVSSDKKKLEQAKVDWVNQKFPKVKNENEYIPYPNIKLK